MKEQLSAIRSHAMAAMEGADSLAVLEELRIQYLGKKGELTAVMKGMGALSAEERPVIGQLANQVRSEIESALEDKKTALETAAAGEKLAREKIDVTMPGKKPVKGKKHPLITVLDDLKDIFIGMGFSIAEGPEVELDYYNFEALNIPKDHPARDTQDTFYIDETVVMRTQTSPVQVRTMEQQKPPIRIISPGRVYRSDAMDATHSPVFHQVEGLVIDKNITMADLKGTLEVFVKKLYGEETRLRFRPHHFPFTEPSVAVCDKEKVIVQVTSECSSTKILSTFETLKKRIIELSILERRIQELTDQKQLTQADRDALDKCRGKYNTTKDIRGYRIKFLFLTNDTSNLRKNQRVQGAIVPNGLQFDYKNDILDFASLINSVLRDISCGPQAEKLEKFMQSNPDVFVRKEFGKPNIQRIIDDYASNYVSPLFLHKYEDSGITLQNLYIDPSISRIYALDRQKSYLYAEAQGENRDMIGVLCDFLWQKRKNDKERILFIEGDAAIGKTSLISWLCYHYSQIDTEDDTRARRIGRAIFMNRKIVCIRLRELNFSTPGQSAISVVLKYLEIESLESFNNQYANAILLLDGADELSMVSGIASSSIETFLLDLRKAFSDHKLIVTTRPKFLNMDAFNKATFQTRHIVLNHFNKEMRQEWLEKYKACGETIPSSTETYILSLSDEMASGVADTPLALYLLVRCDMREELQGNNWALFHEIFSNAIVEAEYNENFRSTANDLRHRKAQTNYQVVCRIAYQMFQNAKEERYYVTESEIQEAIRDTDLNGISPDLIRQTCALCAYWKNSTTLGALEFYHNNIRDFFLCEYLCGELITCFREATKETLVADLIELGCRVFAWGNIPGTTWEQTLAFLYLRLKYEKESARKDDSLFDLIQRKPHIHPVMHMLAMGSRLWNYNYQDVPYLCAKYTFVNMMMLIRVLMEFIHDREKLPVINLWHDDAEKELWSRIGILRDWRELFAGSVVISDSLRIGIGSRTYLGDINLSQSTLIKPDFRGAILTNSQFQKSQIQQGTFAEAELTGSDFSESNMPGANFTKANLANASFEGATLLKAVFSGASLLDVSFVSANVNGACFTGSRVEGCDWKSAKFGNNSFSYAEVCGITIGNKKVERLIFDHSSVKKLVIQGANLLDICICDSSVFYESNFSRTEFILSNPDFGCIKGATFIDCDFKQSKINGMKCISNVHAEQCSFRDANLNGLRIENCTFVNCDFQDASFMGAVFINCRFSGESTNLIGANFSKADGTHSDFTGINFYRVITKGAKGFEEYDRINPYATLK